MRWPSGAIVILVGFVLLLGGPAVAAAQEGTPGAGAGAAEEGFEPLAFAPLEAVPPAPTLLALICLTYEPGANLPAIAVPGPLVGYIETGTFTVRPEGPVTVTRAATMATPGAAELATPGTDLMLGPGDQIVTPADTAVAYTNTGQAPASALVAGILPAGAPLPTAYPPGVTAEFLASGLASALPAPPVTVAMVRLTYPPGYADPQPAENPGALLAHLEAGTLGYTVAAGEGQVTRATAAATPVATPGAATAVTPGAEETVSVGDAIFEQAGTSSSVRNPGDEPAVVLLVVVGPPAAFGVGEDGSSPGTPAP